MHVVCLFVREFRSLCALVQLTSCVCVCVREIRSLCVCVCVSLDHFVGVLCVSSVDFGCVCARNKITLCFCA